MQKLQIHITLQDTTQTVFCSLNSFKMESYFVTELLQSIPLDSRECKEVINVFYNSLWSPQSYTFEFKYCDLVNNDKLEDEVCFSVNKNSINFRNLDFM